jgi:hypothetical protein
MGTESPLSKDSPVVAAWRDYKQSPEFANSLNWAKQDARILGSMWVVFYHGYLHATERATALAESVNPASDDERAVGTPGAGATSAIVEYRDLIRSVSSASAQEK